MSSLVEPGVQETLQADSLDAGGSDKSGIAFGSKVDLSELTAARGFAAFAVVLFHVDAYCGQPLRRVFPIDTLGMLAVDFFFVLSGFVLTHVYETAWGEGRYSHRNFLVRRFARIWPLHFACLMGVGVIVVAGAYVGLRPPWQADLSSFLSNLFLLNASGLSPELSWNQPAWSVGAEWTAYLLFPLYLAICSAIRPAWAKLAASVLLMVALHETVRISTGLELLALDANGGSLRIVPSFFAGVALRQIYGQGFGAAIPARKLTLLLVALLAAGFMLLVLHAPPLALWPLLPLLIYLLALRALCPETGLLRARPLLWLGDVSYGLYLVHALVLMVTFGIAGKLLGMEGSAGLLAVGTISIALALMVAAVAHYLIELPAQAPIVGWAKRENGGS